MSTGPVGSSVVSVDSVVSVGSPESMVVSVGSVVSTVVGSWGSIVKSGGSMTGGSMCTRSHPRQMPGSKMPYQQGSAIQIGGTTVTLVGSVVSSTVVSVGSMASVGSMPSDPSTDSEESSMIASSIVGSVVSSVGSTVGSTVVSTVVSVGSIVGSTGGSTGAQAQRAGAIRAVVAGAAPSSPEARATGMLRKHSEAAARLRAAREVNRCIDVRSWGCR